MGTRRCVEGSGAGGGWCWWCIGRSDSIELVRGRLKCSCVEGISSFRLTPGAGEAAREAGGEGGSVGGRGADSVPRIWMNARTSGEETRMAEREDLEVSEELFSGPSCARVSVRGRVCERWD